MANAQTTSVFVEGGVYRVHHRSGNSMSVLADRDEALFQLHEHLDEGSADSER